MRRTWVQDVKRDDAERSCQMHNEKYITRPRFSIYTIGESKSGKPDEAGIYLEDPTG
jgi:hypothetical protein